MLNTAQFVSFSDLLKVSGIEQFVNHSDYYFDDVSFGGSENIYTLARVDYVLDRLIDELVFINFSEEELETAELTVKNNVLNWIANLCREDGKALPSNIYVDMEN